MVEAQQRFMRQCKFMSMTKSKLLYELYGVFQKLERIQPSNPCDIGRLASSSRVTREVSKKCLHAMGDIEGCATEDIKEALDILAKEYKRIGIEV